MHDLIEFQTTSCYPRIIVSAKYKTIDELSAISAEARKAGRLVVFTNGCFDLVHRGHIHLLREAKTLGDILIVGLNSDVSVKAIKGPQRRLRRTGSVSHYRCYPAERARERWRLEP